MFLLDGWLKHQPVNDPTGILFGSETVTWLVVDCHPQWDVTLARLRE